MLRSVTVADSELQSPLPGVSNRAWARFADALAIDDDRGPNQGKPRPFDARTRAGGLGCFGILPRQLVEIKVLEEVFVSKGKAIANPNDKRVIVFLASPLVQRAALEKLMRRHAAALAKVALPADMTFSGALALRHRLGPHALAKWQAHQEPATIKLFRRANGLF